MHQRLRAYEACGNADWVKCSICKQYDDPKNLAQKGPNYKDRPQESFLRIHTKCSLQRAKDRRKLKKLNLR